MILRNVGSYLLIDSVIHQKNGYLDYTAVKSQTRNFHVSDKFKENF